MNIEEYRVSIKDKIEKVLCDNFGENDERTYREWKEHFKGNGVTWQTEGDIRSAFDRLYKDEHRFICHFQNKPYTYSYQG